MNHVFLILSLLIASGDVINAFAQQNICQSQEARWREDFSRFRMRLEPAVSQFRSALLRFYQRLPRQKRQELTSLVSQLNTSRDVRRRQFLARRISSLIHPYYESLTYPLTVTQCHEGYVLWEWTTHRQVGTDSHESTVACVPLEHVHDNQPSRFARNPRRRQRVEFRENAIQIDVNLADHPSGVVQGYDTDIGGRAELNLLTGDVEMHYFLGDGSLDSESEFLATERRVCEHRRNSNLFRSQESTESAR